MQKLLRLVEGEAARMRTIGGGPLRSSPSFKGFLAGPMNDERRDVTAMSIATTKRPHMTPASTCRFMGVGGSFSIERRYVLGHNKATPPFRQSFCWSAMQSDLVFVEAAVDAICLLNKLVVLPLLDNFSFFKDKDSVRLANRA